MESVVVGKAHAAIFDSIRCIRVKKKRPDSVIVISGARISLGVA